MAFSLLLYSISGGNTFLYVCLHAEGQDKDLKILVNTAFKTDVFHFDFSINTYCKENFF